MSSPSVQQAPLVGQTVSSYRIQTCVGRGGMGEVYRAWDTRLNRPVAVKALSGALGRDEVSRTRFLRETEVASKLVHPYVTTVFDVVEHDEDLLLVMEYVEGKGLDRVLTEDRPGSKRIAQYGLEIAEALCAIHKAGLVHRDLKPGNVMITPDDHVKVMDFGVARPVLTAGPETAARGGSAASRTVTEEGVGVGTILYMSPEQVRGARVDGRSDLFSLGVLLYEAVTGEHPFARVSAMETASAILHEPPSHGTEPRTLTDSGPLREVVIHLLEKDVDHRYQTTEQVVEDLRRVIRGEAPRFRARIRRPRGRTALVAAALATAALAVAVWWLGGLGRPQPVLPELHPRPVVAVIPFRDRTGEQTAGLRGEMVADLLAAGLAGTGRLRSLGWERTNEILAGFEGATPQADIIRRVSDTAAGVRWVVIGSLYREGDIYHAAVEVYQPGTAEPAEAFRVAAARTGPLVDLAAARLAGMLAPAPPGETSKMPTVAALSSDSEKARLAELSARRAQREYRFRDAIRNLEHALELDPRFTGARVRLAQVLNQAGYASRAEREARQAVAVVESPGGPPAGHLALEARLTQAQVLDRRDEALEAARALAERYGDEPSVVLELARALRQAGRADEALVEVERALNLDPYDPRVHMLRAVILGRLHRYTDASHALDRAGELFQAVGSRAGEAEVNALRGNLAFERSQHRAAAAFYARSRDGFRGAGLEVLSATCEKAVADMELLQGDLQSARVRLLSVLPLLRSAGNYRQVVLAQDSLAGALYRRGRLDEAEREMREAVRQARSLDNPAMLATPTGNLAHLLAFTGRLEEARPLAEEALELAERTGDRETAGFVRSLLAQIRMLQGDLQGSLAELETVVQEERSESGYTRNLTEALAAKSTALRLAGRTAEALGAIQEAVDLDPALHDRLNLAYSLVDRARLRAELLLWDDALADLERAEELARSEEGSLNDLLPRVQFVRGYLEMLRGRPASARKMLDEAVRQYRQGIENESWEPLLAAARVAVREGDGAAAVHLARQALEMPRAGVPARVEAREVLALALLRSGSPDEAATEARRALDEAENRGMPAVAARAAAVILALPRQYRPEDARAVKRRGSKMLELYLAGVPEDRRDALPRRSDLELVSAEL